MKFIIENWQIIYGPLLAVFAYFTGKKMKKAETQIKQGDAMASMQKSYDEWVIDAKERTDDLKEEIKQLKEMMLLLQKDNLKKGEEMQSLRQAVDASENREKAWKSKHVDLEKKYNSLKLAFEALQKKYKDKVNQTSSDGQ